MRKFHIYHWLFLLCTNQSPFLGNFQMLVSKVFFRVVCQLDTPMLFFAAVENVNHRYTSNSFYLYVMLGSVQPRIVDALISRHFSNLLIFSFFHSIFFFSVFLFVQHSTPAQYSVLKLYAKSFSLNNLNPFEDNYCRKIINK
jgi:hypothetical protein